MLGQPVEVALHDGRSLKRVFETVKGPLLEIRDHTRNVARLDHRAVQEIAARLGYPETTMWVREHQQEYLEGVSRGFVVAE